MFVHNYAKIFYSVGLVHSGSSESDAHGGYFSELQPRADHYHLELQCALCDSSLARDVETGCYHVDYGPLGLM